MKSKIDWEKEGQVVCIGDASDFDDPHNGRHDIMIFVDHEGNCFGSSDPPLYNPITGTKIESINYEWYEENYG